MTRTGSRAWRGSCPRLRAASSARSRLLRLHDNTSDAIWWGSSTDAFRDRIAKLPGHLAKLASSYQDASDGFTGYSAAVRHIAHDATLARTEVSTARNGVSSTARLRAGYVAPAGSPPTPTPYDRAVADAKSRLSDAAGKLTNLADDRRVADSKVKGALTRAHHDGMRNRSWWQRAGAVRAHQS